MKRMPTRCWAFALRAATSWPDGSAARAMWTWPADLPALWRQGSGHHAAQEHQRFGQRMGGAALHWRRGVFLAQLRHSYRRSRRRRRFLQRGPCSDGKMNGFDPQRTIEYAGGGLLPEAFHRDGFQPFTVARGRAPRARRRFRTRPTLNRVARRNPKPSASTILWGRFFMFAPPAMEPGKSGACGKASTHFRQMEKRAAKTPARGG